MLSLIAHLLRAGVLGLASAVVSSPFARWTWRPLTPEALQARLAEIRPSDPQSVTDMLAGKYLFASSLVETGGVSPFSVPPPDIAWRDELHGFAWLRHFSQIPAGPDRNFARTLVLDWIGRHHAFDRRHWSNALTARRVCNWLTHYDLIAGGATAKECAIIARALAAQAHALAQRGPLDADPVGRLFAAIGVLAFGLSEEPGRGQLDRRAARLVALLRAQLDGDGLHRSRSPRIQFELLEYLVPLRLALMKHAPEPGKALGMEVERMHAALGALTLTTGEPGYFNGTGQLPFELLLAVQSNGGQRAEGDGLRTASGYGLMQIGSGRLIVDSGLMPQAAFTSVLHASALAFEFSFGNALIVGNCGPAPAPLMREANAFRRTAAHSALEIGEISTARFGLGPFARRHALARAPAEPIVIDTANATLELKSRAYEPRFGIAHTRALSLIDNGETLIGQDVLNAAGGRTGAAPFAIRFHLAPGTSAEAEPGHDLIRLKLRNGEQWVFLWEGAEAGIEPSVRQSLHHGLLETQQIVLSGIAAGRMEIAWSFARQAG